MFYKNTFSFSRISAFFKRTEYLLCLIFLVFLSSIFSLFALGYSYPARILSPGKASALGSSYAKGWSPGDGWIEDKGVVSFPNLASTGNRAVVTVKEWRPEAAGDALLSVLSCGRTVAELAVTKTISFHVPLDNSTCAHTGLTQPHNPLVNSLVFSVKNPFSPGDKDLRSLSVQLESVYLTSILGVPIVSPYLVILTALLLCLPGLVLILGKIGSAFFSCLLASFFSACLALVISRSSWATSTGIINFLALEAVVFLITVGAAFGKVCYSNETSKRDVFSGNLQISRISNFRLYPPAILVLITAIGAGLRFYGLDFGLPAPFHPDETPKFNAIMGMLSRGDFNPQYFLHPSLLLYLSLGVNQLIILFGSIFPSFSWEQAATIRLSGRIVSAVAGTCSIPVLYLIATRLFSPNNFSSNDKAVHNKAVNGTAKGVGLMAAALLAVFPLHVTCSRYMKEDVLMTFWILCAVLMVVIAAQNRSVRALLLAGVFGGVACGTKYSAVLILPAIATAPWLATRSIRPDLRLLIMGLFAALLAGTAFVVTTPYCLIDTAAFLKGVYAERNHAVRGHSFPIDSWSQLWMYHLWRSLLPGTATLPLIFGLLGCGLMIVRRRMEDVWILSLILLFYLPAEWVKSKPAPQAERYMVPVLPFLAIASSQLLLIFREKLKQSSYIRDSFFYISIGILALGFPITKSVLLASEIKNDTRLLLSRWIYENIPAGSRIAIDYSPYDPPFLDNKYQVVRFPPGQLLNEIAINRLGASADYFIFSSLLYDRVFTQPNNNGLRRAILRDTFARYPILKQVEPWYITYGFHNPTVTIFSVNSTDNNPGQKNLSGADLKRVFRQSFRSTALEFP